MNATRRVRLGREATGFGAGQASSAAAAAAAPVEQLDDVVVVGVGGDPLEHEDAVVVEGVGGDTATVILSQPSALTTFF